jgi:hypothetical protein
MSQLLNVVFEKRIRAMAQNVIKIRPRSLNLLIQRKKHPKTSMHRQKGSGSKASETNFLMTKIDIFKSTLTDSRKSV